MPARRKASTVKRHLKTPPPISEPGIPPQETPPETLTADTQTPESQPFEVKVEVETQSPPPEQVNQASQANEPSASSAAPEQPPAETGHEETPLEDNPVPEGFSVQESPSGSGKKWLWLILLIIVLLFVGFGIYTYTKAIKGLGGISATPTPEESATPTPTASASAKLNRGDLKVQVLNGTSVIGLAARAKAYLEGLGYQNVAIGNANQSDLTETAIAIKDSKKNYLDLLTKDLNPKYPLAKTPKTLDPSSPYDVVVTLGQP